MCDWEEEEYAEYLLWSAAQRATAPAAGTTAGHVETRPTRPLLTALPAVAAEA
ncbi:MAG: hypothetical protein ACHQ0I_00300 [Candidatus Lutacidiplasmatales archaeon]|nr:hypothetical protein [Thermoplasmata archaeon]